MSRFVLTWSHNTLLCVSQNALKQVIWAILFRLAVNELTENNTHPNRQSVRHSPGKRVAGLRHATANTRVPPPECFTTSTLRANTINRCRISTWSTRAQGTKLQALWETAAMLEVRST